MLHAFRVVLAGVGRVRGPCMDVLSITMCRSKTHHDRVNHSCRGYNICLNVRNGDCPKNGEGVAQLPLALGSTTGRCAILHVICCPRVTKQDIARRRIANRSMMHLVILWPRVSMHHRTLIDELTWLMCDDAMCHGGEPTKSHFQPSVEIGTKNVDKNIDTHNKQ